MTEHHDQDLVARVDALERRIVELEGSRATWAALNIGLGISKLGLRRLNARTKQLEGVAQVISNEFGRRLSDDERKAFDDAVQLEQMAHADEFAEPQPSQLRENEC